MNLAEVSLLILHKLISLTHTHKHIFLERGRNKMKVAKCWQLVDSSESFTGVHCTSLETFQGVAFFQWKVRGKCQSFSLGGSLSPYTPCNPGI